MYGPELYEIAREFLDKEFNMDLDIPIFINTRMKTMFGCFRHRKNNRTGVKTALQIDMSKEFIDTHPREHIIDVLKHELVHYALFEQGKPHKDGQQYFEDTLKRLGISSTRTYKTLGRFHKYTCNCKGRVFYRKRRIPKSGYCPDCKTLHYVGEVERTMN